MKVPNPTRKKMQIFGMGRDVGILREQWTLPSDHLPIGMSFHGAEIPLHVGMWNVLNNQYINYVLADHAGLLGSAITKLNSKTGSGGLTERDVFIVELIVNDMLSSSAARPRDIMSLQECGTAFSRFLKKSLPKNYALIEAAPHEKDQTVLLYNRDRFNPVQVAITQGIFTDRPARTMVNVLLEEKSKALYRILSAHLPWIPDGPAAQQLVQYVKKQLHKDNPCAETIMLMGDMNKSEITINAIFNAAGLHDFKQISPYPTFIPMLRDGLYTRSACFDHFFVFGKNHDEFFANSADEVLPGLGALAKKLE